MTETKEVSAQALPSMKPSLKLFSISLAIGLMLVSFLIVSTFLISETMGGLLAFCWFILLLVIEIGSVAVAAFTYGEVIDEVLSANRKYRY